MLGNLVNLDARAVANLARREPESEALQKGVPEPSLTDVGRPRS